MKSTNPSIDRRRSLALIGAALIGFLGAGGPAVAQDAFDSKTRSPALPAGWDDATRTEFARLFDDLRAANPGEADKVRTLAAKEPESALQFLRDRSRKANKQTPKPAPDAKTDRVPDKQKPVTGSSIAGPLPARLEPFERLDGMQVGQFTVDLCRRSDGALVPFHTTPGDRLRNVSRGEALEFETTIHGGGEVNRFVFVAAGDSRINLWTRGFELAHAELRTALNLPERTRELFVQWPPFSRKGFH